MKAVQLNLQKNNANKPSICLDYTSNELYKLGIDVVFSSTLEFNENRLKTLYPAYFEDCNLAIILFDNLIASDLKKIICEISSDVLEQNDFAYNYINSHFKQQDKVVSLEDYENVKLPKKSRALLSKNCSKCGFLIEKNDKQFIFLPNDISVLKSMFKESIVSILKNNYNIPKAISFKTFGINKNEIMKFLPEISNPTFDVTIRENLPECELIVRYNSQTLKSELDDFLEQSYEMLSEFIITTEDETISQIIIDMLETKNKTLSIFEECSCGSLINIFLNENDLADLYITQSKIVPKIAITSNDYSSVIYNIALNELELNKTNYVLCTFRENKNLNNFSIVVGDAESIHIFNEVYRPCNTTFEDYVSKCALFYFLKKLKFNG